MKEAFVILIVLAVIAGSTAIRYRKQIATALQIWRSLKSMRNQMKESRDRSAPERSVSAGPLVNCAKCGTWVPEDRAISLRGGVFYCSSACLETTANVS